MSNILSKKHVGYFLGAVMALSFGVIAMTGVSHASAAALTADQLFGDLEGTETGSDFASTAGLGDADLVDTISKIIRIALGFLGVIAVVMLLYGGFMWMTAAGNDDRVKDAKKIMYAGLIGLVIILTAYAIASFVIDSLISATSSTTSSSSSSSS